MPPGTPPPIFKLNRPKPNLGGSWKRLTGRANAIGSIVSLFVFLVVVGGVGGYYYAQSRKAAPAAKTSISTLTPAEIAQLTEVGSNLGTSGQTLNIGANTLFRGTANVTGDLTIGGKLNANGPVTLSQLNITGTTAATGLNVGSNLNVTGNTTMQQSLSVSGLTTLGGGLNVGGAASFNSINATSLSVSNINISGPLRISHLATQGPTPIFVPGTSVGGGGTGSISGNDTAGTLNFNTGGGPPAGVLGTITFRAAFSGTPHVLLSPLTGSAAGTPVYVTRTTGGFQVRTDAAPPAGAVLSFDYFVTQ
jgi:hypothetical protein